MGASKRSVAPGAVRNGDTDCSDDGDVVALYRNERARLRRSISGIVDRDRAEDLVQDTFITYLTRAPEAARPRAWLAKVARNRALNEVRRAREVPIEDRADESEGAHAGVERDAVREVVAGAMASLPDRSRRALRMRFFEEREYSEIAAALGVRVEQAHVVMHRALRRLGAEIVRRLAGHHDAEQCASALASMAGVIRDGEGHSPGPCDRCSPVWDEIVALHGMEIALPLATSRGGGLLRRIADEVAARVPVLMPERIASVALAAGMAVASVGLPSPAPPQVSAPVVRAEARVASVRRAPESKQNVVARPAARSSARTDRDRPGAPAPKRVAHAGPVSVNEGEDHTQGGAQTPGGASGAGAVVCQPLQPCPPAPAEG